MKVYGLFGVYADGEFSIIGLFSTYEKAAEARDQEEREKRYCYTHIKEMVVDSYK